MNSNNPALLHEVRLHENHSEREQMENMSELFAVLNALECLEKMFSRDYISHEDYKVECFKLLDQYKVAMRLVHGTDVEAFAAKYRLHCPAALERIHEGRPITVKDDKGNVLKNIAVIVEKHGTSKNPLNPSTFLVHRPGKTQPKNKSNLVESCQIKMELVLLKTPLTISAKTLKSLTNNFREYTKKPVYSATDEQAFEESQAAADLISEAIQQISIAKEELKALVAQIKRDYDKIKAPGEREDFSDALEKLEIETNFNEILGTATEMTYMLKTRLTEVISHRNRLGRRLGLIPTEMRTTNATSKNIELEITDNEWISEDSNESTETNKMPGSRTCNNIKPPALMLPKFFGVEEDFPEFWAVYETLVHKSTTLSTVEKMLLLKDSLKGNSDSAIRGIQLIPQNYGWMIDALKKKYGNKPINRARIVHRLTILTPATKTAESCAYVFDKIQMLVNQMVSAGQDVRKTNDAMWTEMILDKFPYDIVKNVLIAIKGREEVTIEEIMENIEKEISAITYVQSRLKGHQRKFESTTDARPTKTSAATTGPLCAFCNKAGHYATNCRSVTDVQTRRNIVMDKQLCWKCCSNTHMSKDCSRPNCQKCGREHQASLCFDRQSSSGTSNTQSAARKNNTSPFKRTEERTNSNWKNNTPYNLRPRDKLTTRNKTPNQTNFGIDKTRSDGQRKEQIVLMAAEGMIWNHNTESFEKILFFFDTGAQKTVIREELAQRLGLPKLRTETCVMSGLGGHTEMFKSTVVSIKVGSAYGKDMEALIQTKPVISKGFPSVKLNEVDKEFLQKKEICIANTKLRGEMQNPDVLVGLDLYYSFVFETPESMLTPSGLRVARTIFGPTLYGRGTTDGQNENASVTYGMTAIIEPESELLNKLFELEGLGISKDEYAQNDEVFNYFESYSKEISFQDGFITAPFPLKNNISDLTDNYPVAYRRLIALQNHLTQNERQKDWYCKILREYKEQNIIEEVTYDITNAAGVYYMPHSGVWREHKAKPLRVVFDASSKQKRCLSLNDVIHKGESFVNKIHDILVASRMSKIILLCDIEAAFTQIRLQETHKDLCRFLWLKNPDLPPTKNNIMEFRFNRLPFGVTASPSILNMALVAYLNSKTSQISSEIIKNIYVDNILLHANNPKEALMKYTQGKALFAEIGMNVREFVSNSELVNNEIPEIDKISGGSIKFLGVPYNTDTDTFSIKVTFPIKENLTKRDIVSQLNSIYDPIGIVAPLTVKLKSLMREIYEAGTDWNENIPSELTKKWNTACKEIENTEVVIPRYIGRCQCASTLISYDLWVFADASNIALATCSFLQHIETGDITPLVSGKTRLTPKKTLQTIPRLEMLAMLMAMRLAKNIIGSITEKIRQLHVVGDSEITLCWIKSNRKLPVFVRNQRERILKLKNELESNEITVKFHHVSTAYNPADAGTRGVSSRQIHDIDWINGPQWLNGPGPHKQLRDISEMVESNIEKAPMEVQMANILEDDATDQDDSRILVDFTRFSRVDKLIRTVARVGKLIKAWVRKLQERGFQIQLTKVTSFSDETEITAEDMQLSEQLILANYHENVGLQKLQKRFPQKKIIVDDKGIIRHESRLQNALLPYDTKLPIYIDPKSELARLILQDIHEKNAHCGKEHTLSIARQRFWIPRPSGAFRRFLKGCVTCKRWQGLPFGAPNMPSLPNDRVVITKPFDKVGCDFMGPISLKTQEKVYVCLYTCLTIRAVHLEVVENMTTGAFLNSFIRFISRRGVPSLIRTDCGTNFKLGQHILDTMFEKDPVTGSSVMSYSATCGIKWIFNPPGAPWMGGAWERLIGTVKKAFRKAIGRRKLDLSELCTTLARIEAIINTRPLTKLDSTDISEIPIRPVDFLQPNLKFDLKRPQVEGDSADLNFDPELIQTAQQASEALQHSEEIADKYWERWNLEYLTALREIQRISLKQPRHIPMREPVVGEIVLIQQENLPRGNWSFGKITELIKSLDGQVRSAKILLPNKHVWQRPLNAIYPLELQSERGEIIDNNNPPDIYAGDSNLPTGREETQQRRPQRQATIDARTIIRDFERSLEEPDEIDEEYSRSSTPINQILISVIAALCFINPVSSGKLTCGNGSISIINPNTTFELCLGKFCQKFPEISSPKLEWRLPPTTLNNSLLASLRYLQSAKEITEQSTCLQPHICDHSQGILSKKLLANPHCWPNGAIISLGLVIYAVVATLIMIHAYVRRLLTKGPDAANHENINVTVSAQETSSVQLNVFHIPSIYRTSSLTLVCILATVLTGTVQACQEGHIRHETNLVCTNRNNCSYEYKREILFNNIDVKLCISIIHANRSVGLIEIERYPTIMRCASQSQYFTRETTTKVFSAIRCSQAGSCVNHKCAKATHNTTIPELSTAYRHPGYSGCQHSCGGLSCGCLLPLPACSFYRVAHIPKTEEVYEVVSCMKWVPLIQFKLRVLMYNQGKETMIISSPYIKHSFQGIAMTITSVRTPFISVLNRNIANSRTDAILLPEGYQLAAKCSTAKAASEDFATCSNQMVCACEDAHAAINCHCPTMSLTDIRKDISNVLPVHTPYVTLMKRDTEILAETMQGEVGLSIESYSLKDSADYLLEQDCQIAASRVIGCYNCQEGAQVNVTCTTEKPAWVIIECGEHTFSVKCQAGGKTSTIALNYQHAIVQEKCVSQCNNKMITYDLNGTLNFLPDIVPQVLFENGGRSQSYGTDWFEEMKIPDLKPIWHIIHEHWQVTLSMLATITVLSVITYFFGPTLLLALAKLAYISIVAIVKASTLIIHMLYKCLRAASKN